jgi:quinol monooxygenase YgiN
MINVLASIKVKPGTKAEFIKIFKANVPSVKKEKGCVEYCPTIDFDSKIPVQKLDGDVITIIEKWESIEDLKTHLTALHMITYKEKVKDIVESVSLKVLQEA